jgi:hypothetical protein
MSGYDHDNLISRKRILMTAGARTGERPARWWQSQERLNSSNARYTLFLSGTSTKGAVVFASQRPRGPEDFASTRGREELPDDMGVDTDRDGRGRRSGVPRRYEQGARGTVAVRTSEQTPEM